MVHKGGWVEDAAQELGNVSPEALRAWLNIHDPVTINLLGKRIQGGTTIKGARAKARIAVCERIAAEGGNLRDAAGALDTITPNGLYCWLRKYAPATFRRICKPKGDKGSHLQINHYDTRKRYRLIKELGYTKAARRLGLNPVTGRNTLYHWLRYRKKVGCPICSSV